MSVLHVQLLQTARVQRDSQPKQTQSGVGLIEVLVAVVVLSIGFLAAAKMQIEGMRYSQNAYFLSQGNLMLRDITDRMRANSDGVAAGHYANFTTGAATSLPACVTSNTKCTPAQIAAADLHNWNSYLVAPAGSNNFKPLLPTRGGITARGSIVLNAATSVHTISVRWGEQAGDAIEERILSVQLRP